MQGVVNGGVIRVYNASVWFSQDRLNRPFHKQSLAQLINLDGDEAAQAPQAPEIRCVSLAQAKSAEREHTSFVCYVAETHPADSVHMNGKAVPKREVSVVDEHANELVISFMDTTANASCVKKRGFHSGRACGNQSVWCFSMVRRKCSSSHYRERI